MNCTLFRANRIGAIYTMLGNACFVLGVELRREADLFWAEHPEPDLRPWWEIHRFAAFLRRRMRAGEIENPYLEEVLGFELASYDIGFLPRRRVLAELEEAGEGVPGAPLRLHPLVRVAPFRHEPVELLRLLGERRAPPYAVEEGEFYLLIDRRGEEREVTRIDARLGRALWEVEAGTAALSAAEEAALRGAGVVVRG